MKNFQIFLYKNTKGLIIPFLFIMLIVTILLFNLSLQCFATDETAFVWSSQENTVPTSNVSTSEKNSENGIENANDNNKNNPLNLESGSAILVEQTTGQVLYSHNVHEQMRPASVTKVMSLLLIMEQIDSGKLNLTDQIPCSEKAASMGGSQIWLDTTETLSVDDMLKAICVNSANDCVYAMAEYVAGSEEAFVSMMNDKAKELGMNDTTFKNCHGLDEDGHVTSSYDISLMSCELLNKYPQITNYTSIWMDSLREGKSELANTNKLIRNYKGATGLKTGSTSLALYNLSASATRDGMSLVAVIMKASTSKVRFAEASKLLDYGFANYTFKQFANKGDVLKDAQISKGTTSTVKAVFDANSGVLIEKGQESNVVQNVSIEKNLSAPIEKGQKLGEVIYSLNDKVIATSDIVADESVDKINILGISKNVFWSWLSLLRN